MKDALDTEAVCPELALLYVVDYDSFGEALRRVPRSHRATCARGTYNALRRIVPRARASLLERRTHAALTSTHGLLISMLAIPTDIKALSQDTCTVFSLSLLRKRVGEEVTRAIGMFALRVDLGALLRSIATLKRSYQLYKNPSMQFDARLDIPSDTPTEWDYLEGMYKASLRLNVERIRVLWQAALRHLRVCEALAWHDRAVLAERLCGVLSVLRRSSTEETRFPRGLLSG